MFLVRLAFAALFTMVCVPAAQAADFSKSSSPAIEASAFDVAAVSDRELSGVVGQGFLRTNITRQIAQDEWQSVSRINAAVLSTTFDNWFTDVGNPLIFSNIVAERSLLR